MSLALQTHTVSDGQGQVLEAHQAFCDCDDDANIFFLYWPVHLDHPHAKCGQCEEAHCIYNVCQMPPMLPEEPEDY